MTAIDFNSDVGEGIGYDALIMPFLSSCNIACGAHAGSKDIIRETIRLALENRVKIGAHPSYPDRINFGRRIVSLSKNELKATITEQLRLVQTIAQEEGTQVVHVKPHGALYNQASKDPDIADCIVESLLEVMPDAVLYAAVNSILADRAKPYVKIMREGFADRNYTQDYRLVSRQQPNALLLTPHTVWGHVKRMLLEQQLQTIDGHLLPFTPETLCFHGDHPEVVAILSYVYQQCQAHQIQVL